MELLQDESMLLELPAMGRGRPSAAMLAERARLQKVIEENRKRLAAQADSVSDTQMLEEIQYRFDMLSRYAIAAASGEIRCLVGSGSPGIGKSWDLMKTLDDIIPGEYEVIEGGDISPVHLFMAGYRNREAGRVLVFDDSDGLFMKDECCNILKKLTDSSPVRRLTYMKASPVLETEGVPNEYTFEGSVIFLSNLNFERMATGSDRRAQHIAALNTRSLVLDLQIHTPRAKYIWVRYKAVTAILPNMNVTEETQTKVLEYLDKHYDRFKSLSLRTIEYLVTTIRMNGENWQKDANIMLLK